jgi:hypothetical protein
MWSKEEDFEREQVQKYKERRPRTSILGRLVFTFIGKEKVPPQYRERDPNQDGDERPVRKRPDSLTLAKYAGMRKNAEERGMKAGRLAK